jgi:Icc-related predicted phosphoesterase
LDDVRVLAVSDEVDERLWSPEVRTLAPDLVIGCGDVDFELLGWLAEATGAPVVFVPGNHDPDVAGYRPTASGLVVRAGFVTRAPWPDGTVNADGRVVDAAGLRLAGLGGSIRYREGPNQYTQRQQGRRARRLAYRARWRWRDRAPVDVIIAHSAPSGLGDGDDPAHRGFTALNQLARTLTPRLLLHGHVAPSPGAGDHWIGNTRVVNVFGYRLLDVATAVEVAPTESPATESPAAVAATGPATGPRGAAPGRDR